MALSRFASITNSGLVAPGTPLHQDVDESYMFLFVFGALTEEHIVL